MIRSAGLIVCFAGALLGQGEFWGELKPGAHAVGFRAVYQNDIARSYDADYQGGGKKARPVLIAMWYPAKYALAHPMVQRDYLRALTLDEAAPEFAQRLRRFTRDQACEYMIGKQYRALTEEEKGTWEGLLSTPVFAGLNAPPADGRFPVLIYHPGLGGTYEDNAVACEFLASHGYVVVSSAYQPADSSSLEVNGELETSFADLAFLLRYASGLPFVDAGRVGAIGHSYGAQAVMGWRAQPGSPLDAVVFLDSNLVYAGVDAPQFARVKAALERNRDASTPMAIFVDRERGPHTETLDRYLRYAARYEVAVTGLEHNAFVSQGAIRAGEQARRNYEAVCAGMLQFLNAHVKGDEAALAALHGQAGYRAGAPPQATGMQIARMVRADGEANAVLRAAPADAITSAAGILSDEGQRKDALALLRAAERVHGKSALIAFTLGEALRDAGETAEASAAFEKALALVDGDETLSAAEKARLREAAGKK